MKFANLATYVKDAEKIARVRPAHREYLTKLLAEGKLVVAGPLANDAGALIVFEAADLAAAEEIAKNDPCNLEGVIASYELKEWKMVFNNPDLIAA